MEITPLMETVLKKSDSEEIIKRAQEIATAHRYTLRETHGVPARFHTFLTEEDVTIRARNDYYLVPENSELNFHRWNAALKQARQEIE